MKKSILKKAYHKVVPIEKRIILYCRRKIKKTIRENPKLRNSLSKEYANNAVDFWVREYGISIKPHWHVAYASVNGIKDVSYIPEDVSFSKIIPKLNNMDLNKAYSDKNAYTRIFENIDEPEVILRNMNGSYFNFNYKRVTKFEAEKIFKKINKEFIVKPSIDSGGGKQFYAGIINNGEIYLNNTKVNLNKIEQMYSKDFIIQEKIIQHEELSKFHPKSLNTLRILTLRLKHSIIPLSSVVRFGNNDSVTDNKGTGGLSCGLDGNGNFNKFAIDEKHCKHVKHPFSKVEFKGNQIPNFQKIIKKVITLHEQLVYFDYISWDVSIRENGNPVIIEINLGYQGIDLHQYNNGPVFKEYLNHLPIKRDK